MEKRLFLVNGQGDSLAKLHGFHYDSADNDPIRFWEIVAKAIGEALN